MPAHGKLVQACLHAMDSAAISLLLKQPSDEWLLLVKCCEVVCGEVLQSVSRSGVLQNLGLVGSEMTQWYIKYFHINKYNLYGAQFEEGAVTEVCVLCCVCVCVCFAVINFL